MFGWSGRWCMKESNKSHKAEGQLAHFQHLFSTKNLTDYLQNIRGLVTGAQATSAYPAGSATRSSLASEP